MPVERVIFFPEKNKSCKNEGPFCAQKVTKKQFFSAYLAMGSCLKIKKKLKIICFYLWVSTLCKTQSAKLVTIFEFNLFI